VGTGKGTSPVTKDDGDDGTDLSEFMRESCTLNAFASEATRETRVGAEPRGDGERSGFIEMHVHGDVYNGGVIVVNEQAPPRAATGMRQRNARTEDDVRERPRHVSKTEVGDIKSDELMEFMFEFVRQVNPAFGWRKDRPPVPGSVYDAASAQGLSYEVLSERMHALEEKGMLSDVDVVGRSSRSTDRAGLAREYTHAVTHLLHRVDPTTKAAWTKVLWELELVRRSYKKKLKRGIPV